MRGGGWRVEGGGGGWLRLREMGGWGVEGGG